jgi:hypothetical protein
MNALKNLKTILALALLSILVSGVNAGHEAYVEFFPPGAPPNEFIEFTVFVENTGYTNEDIEEIRVRVQTKSDETPFLIDEETLYDGIPQEDGVPMWYVHTPRLAYDEDDNLYQLAYLSHPEHALEPEESVEISFTVLTPEDVGEYNWYVSTFDGEGDREEERIEVVVEDEFPKASITGAPSSWKNTPVEAGIKCVDKGEYASGCAPETYYLLTVGTGDCPEDPIQYLERGSEVPKQIEKHSRLCGIASDYAGNLVFLGPVEFKIENQAPTSSIASQSEWQDKDFTVDFTFKDEGGSGLKKCFYRAFTKKDNKWIQTKAWKDLGCSGKQEKTFSLKVSDEVCPGFGKDYCKLEAYAEDMAGNTGEEVQAKYSLDWDDPFARIDSIEPVTEKNGNKFVSGVVKVNGIAKDENLEEYWLEVDGNKIRQASKTVEWGFLAGWDTTQFQDGRNELVLVVQDLSGKQSRDSIQVSIDNQAPTTSITNPQTMPGGTLDFTGSLSVTLSASERGKTFYRYYAQGQDAPSWTQYQEPFPVSSQGSDSIEYILEYYSVDELGNQEMVKKVTVTKKAGQAIEVPGTGFVVGFESGVLVGLGVVAVAFFLLTAFFCYKAWKKK